MIENKSIRMIICASFLFPLALCADEPQLLVTTDGNTTITQSCVLDSSSSLGYTGDAAGKRLFTKEEYVYKCSKTTSEIGECLNWIPEKEQFDLSNIKSGDVAIEAEDFSGSMGTAIATVQAYTKINGLWSGWHGICQKGKDDGNWDWLSDPYVLASYAISAYAGTAGADASQATTLANQQVEITESALSQAMQTGYHSGSATLVDSTRETLTKVQAVQLTAQATERMTKYAICAARAGLDIAKMVDEYEDDGEPCDPVDEMCPGDGSEDSAPDDGEIFTISEQELTDLINSSPDYADYFEILASNGGVVSVRAKKPSNTQLDMNMAAAKEAAKKAKMMMLKIRAAFTVIQTASCVMGAANAGGSQSGTGSMAAQILSPQNMATMGASIMMGPFAGIAMDMAFNTFASLQDIDTCSSHNDAKEKGSRHLATLESNRAGMCHFIDSVESGNNLSMNKRTKYSYCCYDDKLTRILVEQAKAQLLKDWQHCTDITVNELKNLKFKECTDSDRTQGIDGTKLDAYSTYAQRSGAYQYKQGCVDMDEFMNHMVSTFSTDDLSIDDATLKEQIELFKINDK